MSAFFYTAKLAPMGHRLIDDVRVDETTFAKYMERPWHVKVRLAHDPLKKIGQFHDLRVSDSWWQGEFLLDPALRSELKVGQPVSIGCYEMKRLPGLIFFNEVSVVRSGAIPGAEIISRREMKSAAPAPRKPAAPARTKPAGEVSFGHGQMIRRPNIGKVIAVQGRPVGRSAVSARTASVMQALQAMPDDGFSTLYDEYGNEISRTRIAGGYY